MTLTRTCAAMLVAAMAGAILLANPATPALAAADELAAEAAADLQQATAALDRATRALAAIEDALAGLDDVEAADDVAIAAEDVDELAPAISDAALEIIAERITRSDLLAQRREAEDAVAVAGRAFDAATLRTTWEAGQPGSTGMVWPVAGASTSQFGPRVHPISGAVRHHDGIDVPAPTGTPILAAKGGTVTRADWHGGYGRTVDIDHGNGHMTRYAHASSLAVVEGDEVETGQKIAEVGSSGSSTGPHLHFEVHLGADAVDPFDWY